MCGVMKLIDLFCNPMQILNTQSAESTFLEMSIIIYREFKLVSHQYRALYCWQRLITSGSSMVSGKLTHSR